MNELIDPIIFLFGVFIGVLSYVCFKFLISDKQEDDVSYSFERTDLEYIERLVGDGLSNAIRDLEGVKLVNTTTVNELSPTDIDATVAVELLEARLVAYRRILEVVDRVLNNPTD